MMEKLKLLVLKIINIVIKYPTKRRIKEIEEIVSKEYEQEELNRYNEILDNSPGQPYIGSPTTGLCLIVFDSGRQDECFNNKTQVECDRIAGRVKNGAIANQIISNRTCEDYGVVADD